MRVLQATVVVALVAMTGCGDGSGVDGNGTDACGPDTCAGCCDGETCLAGDVATACGVGGLVCVVCDGDIPCNAGGCGLVEGEACDGLATPCAGSQVCLVSVVDDESACHPPCASDADCAEGRGCYLGSEILVDVEEPACTPLPSPDDSFFVFPIHAWVGAQSPGGGAWDTDGSGPDLLVEVCAGDQCDETAADTDRTHALWADFLGPFTHDDLQQATVRLWDVDGPDAREAAASWDTNATSLWDGHTMRRELVDGEVRVILAVVPEG